MQQQWRDFIQEGALFHSLPFDLLLDVLHLRKSSTRLDIQDYSSLVRTCKLFRFLVFSNDVCKLCKNCKRVYFSKANHVTIQQLEQNCNKIRLISVQPCHYHPGTPYVLEDNSVLNSGCPRWFKAPDLNSLAQYRNFMMWSCCNSPVGWGKGCKGSLHSAVNWNTLQLNTSQKNKLKEKKKYKESEMKKLDQKRRQKMTQKMKQQKEIRTKPREGHVKYRVVLDKKHFPCPFNHCIFCEFVNCRTK